MVSHHSHDHAQAQVQAPHHAHSHGPAAPHPAQAVAWSILRMTVLSRLMAALAVSAVLWGMIWLAIK